MWSKWPWRSPRPRPEGEGFPAPPFVVTLRGSPMSKDTRKLFGTDGIRGIANRDPMTAEVALRLGQAVAQRFRHPDRPGRIVIGKDTRLSGYMLESALQAGIVSA